MQPQREPPFSASSTVNLAISITTANPSHQPTASNFPLSISLLLAVLRGGLTLLAPEL